MFGVLSVVYEAAAVAPAHCSGLLLLSSAKGANRAMRLIKVCFSARFPKDAWLRKQWEKSLRRRGFSATRSSRICSQHFRPEDLDRTGQTVRIREGVVPSVFSFSSERPRKVQPGTRGLGCSLSSLLSHLIDTIGISYHNNLINRSSSLITAG